MYHFDSVLVHSCIGTNPLFPLFTFLGVHRCVYWPALVRLGPVPLHHEAACRVDDSPVLVFTFISGPRP